MHDVQDSRRKRARFRSWHRGTREMDLILGRFADESLAGLTGSELDQYERLLDISDTDLLAWITGAKAVPAGVEPIFFKVRDFGRRAVSQT
jgi:antitoxin CptB